MPAVATGATETLPTGDADTAVAGTPAAVFLDAPRN
jgi:hypothetical protein